MTPQMTPGHDGQRRLINTECLEQVPFEFLFPGRINNSTR